MKISFITGLMLTCFIFVAAGQASPHLHLKNGILYVSNVAKKAVQNPSHADWEKILSVYTDEAFRKKINQPVAGDYAWSGDTIVFRPAFSFASGRN